MKEQKHTSKPTEKIYSTYLQAYEAGKGSGGAVITMTSNGFRLRLETEKERKERNV